MPASQLQLQDRALRRLAFIHKASRTKRPFSPFEKLRRPPSTWTVRPSQKPARRSRKKWRSIPIASARDDVRRKRLCRICDRLEGGRWMISDGDLCCALRRSYRRGRKACAVRARNRPQSFHSLRKRVKGLVPNAHSAMSQSDGDARVGLESGFQVGKLARDRPVLRRTARARDLVQTSTTLRRFGNRLAAEEGCRDDERIVLLGLICTREPELEQIALDLGARFFAEKPLAFERRLLRYAREWPTRPA